MSENILSLLVGLQILIPFTWCCLFGLLLIFKSEVSEKIPLVGLRTGCILILIINFFLGFQLLIKKQMAFSFHFGDWFYLFHYHFPWDFRFSSATFFFSTLTILLVSVIGHYSRSYLHKEPGFFRFFVLIGLFIFGEQLILLGNSIDILFMGWELVGSTSVMLISFYTFKEQAVKNSFWAISSYRLCDIGLLLSSAVAHFYLHNTNIEFLNQAPLLAPHKDQMPLMVITFLIIFASLAKAGQFPFVSWVPRAMEGPTPSSALYYGALSVSLGPILLIRFMPLIEHFFWARIILIGIALATAPFALMSSKSRTDAKSILAYSTVLQMSFIFIEIALGLKWIAIAHIISNAFMRLYQFLRSLNTIQDFYENPLFFRGSLIEVNSPEMKIIPQRFHQKIYYLAVNSFGLDNIIQNKIIERWMGMLNKINHFENKIIDASPITEHPEWQEKMKEI